MLRFTAQRGGGVVSGKKGFLGLFSHPTFLLFSNLAVQSVSWARESCISCRDSPTGCCPGKCSILQPAGEPVKKLPGLLRGVVGGRTRSQALLRNFQTTNYYSYSSEPTPIPAGLPPTPPNGKNFFLWSCVGRNHLWPVFLVLSSSESSRVYYPLSLQPPPRTGSPPAAPFYSDFSVLFKRSPPPMRMNTYHHPRSRYIDKKFLVPAPG